MPSRKTGISIVALVALLLLAASPGAASPASPADPATAAPAAGKALAKAAAHPEVDAAESCDGCHADVTPKPFKLWFEGRHGLMGVKCVVCHGSVGSGFTKKPKADRCGGCHGEKAAAMSAPFFKGKSCFTCHQPHALNPHVAFAGGEK
jgi:hypothetical protein